MTTQINSEKIVELLITKMKEDHHIFWVDPEVHSTQHEFLQLLIEERAEVKARRERIKEKVAGSLILSGTLALVGIIGAGVLDWLKVHLK